MFKTVVNCEAIIYPVYIDRQSYSIIFNLRMISKELTFDHLEVSKKVQLEYYIKKYPDYKII